MTTRSLTINTFRPRTESQESGFLAVARIGAGDSGGRGDRDAAACLLLERHGHLVCGSPSASATSSRIMTASASQKCLSLRKRFRYSLSDFDSRQRSLGWYSIEARY